MASLLDDFAAAVALFPDRVAIVDGSGVATTFNQLNTRVDGLTRYWRGLGVVPGTRVLLAMRLDADLYASLAALWSLGATVVLPEPAMGVAGLRHAARVTGARAFCSAGGYGVLKYVLPELWSLRHLRPKVIAGPPLDLPRPDAADIALISFTSGTTGAPKAIPRSHKFLSAQHKAIAPLLESAKPETDLVAFPVFVLINIASGRTSVLPNWKMSRLGRLAPAQLTDWIAAQAVTRVLLPPSLCEKLSAGDIPVGLHAVFTGGGPVFPDMIDRLLIGKNDLRVACVYGSTEAEPIAHLEARDITAGDLARMTAGQGLLVGQAVDGLQIRIVDGEIQVAGDHVNGGYLDPAHDAENKVLDNDMIWHRTGDAGYFDAQERLWLLGRVGSQVDAGGVTRFPFSVEVAARGWAGVVQSALVQREGRACLAIEGRARDLETWTAQAAKFGITDVVHVAKIPMDRRHGSKIDRVRLKTLIER